MNGAMLLQVGLVLAVTAGVYLILIRPQLRRVAAHQVFVAALKPGDRIVSGGGLVGQVIRCTGPLLTVEIADGVHVQALRSSVEALPPIVAKVVAVSAAATLDQGLLLPARARRIGG